MSFNTNLRWRMIQLIHCTTRCRKNILWHCAEEKDVNMNVNLYSTLGSHEVLSMVLYSDWFILAQAQLLSFCHSFILRRSHLLPVQHPGKHTGLPSHVEQCLPLSAFRARALVNYQCITQLKQNDA